MTLRLANRSTCRLPPYQAGVPDMLRIIGWRLAALVLSVTVLSSCSDRPDALTAFHRGDYAEAFRLWRPLAESGDTQAQNYLGILYQLGLGVGRDYKQAFRWYHAAAVKGNPDAQRNLGTLYQTGEGTTKSNLRAYAWYYVALKHGSAKAQDYIDAMAGKLTPNQQMKARGLMQAYLPGGSAESYPGQ